MWLHHLLSIFVVGSVQCSSSVYPYHTLTTYGSTRSQNKIPAQASEGFLINEYLDESGIERMVHAEPVYAIRPINFMKSSTPTQDGSDEISKAQEAHFRAWCLQQYQVLKREIDFLREEGQEPQTEMLLKFLPLEKFSLTSDHSSIADLPEIKRLRKEHLNIWNQILHTNEDEITSKLGKRTINTELIPTEEIKIIKPNREESKELESQTQTFQEDNFNQRFQATIDRLNVTKASNEVNNASKHLNKDSFETNDRITQIRPPLKPEFIERNSNYTALPTDKVNLEGYMPDFSTDLNLKLFSNHTFKGADTLGNEGSNETKEKDDLKVNNVSEQRHSLTCPKCQTQLLQIHNKPGMDKESLNLQMGTKKTIYEYVPKKIHSELEKLISKALPVYLPQKVIDTVEVMRARDEHLKIVNKAKLVQSQEYHEEVSTTKIV